MDTAAFQNDLVDVLRKHGADLAAFVFAMTYESPQGIMVYGNTIVPVPPRDHEDNLLRNKCTKDATELVSDLTKNVYMGRTS